MVMQTFRSTMKLDADTAARIGEDFWQKWKETVADAAETTRQAAAARSVVDIWSAQVGFGMRNAQRWYQWQPGATSDTSAAEASASPAASAEPAPQTPTATVQPVEPPPVEPEPVEVKAEPEASEAVAAEPLPGADPAGEAPVAAASADSDDLTRIRGIGPAIERKLREHGLTTFQQIAELSDADMTALDNALDFKGRIERDDWVAQAKKLAGRAAAGGPPPSAA